MNNLLRLPCAATVLDAENEMNERDNASPLTRLTSYGEGRSRATEQMREITSYFY